MHTITVLKMAGMRGVALVLLCLAWSGLEAEGHLPEVLPMCGWPLCKEYSVSPPEPINIMTLQVLLGQPQTGVFDSALTAAVRQWQRDHGIKDDGIVGEQTWLSVLPPLVSQGSAEREISALVTSLSYYGFTGLSRSGWSSALQSAVSKFQTSRSLNATGEVRLDTWHALLSDCVPGLGSYGLDLGWPEGAVDLSSWSCLAKAGMEFATIEAYTEGHGFWQVGCGSLLRCCVSIHTPRPRHRHRTLWTTWPTPGQQVSSRWTSTTFPSATILRNSK